MISSAPSAADAYRPEINAVRFCNALADRTHYLAPPVLEDAPAPFAFDRACAASADDGKNSPDPFARHEFRRETALAVFGDEADRFATGRDRELPDRLVDQVLDGSRAHAATSAATTVTSVSSR